MSRTLPSVAALAAVLAIPCLPAQSASYSLSPPVFACLNQGLSNVNLPRIGSVFQLRVPMTFRGYMPPYSVATVLLATGLRNPNLVIPGAGVLRTSAEIVQVMPLHGTGWRLTTVSISIPNSTTLIGMHFYQQSAIFYGSFPRYLCRGGHGVIGK